MLNLGTIYIQGLDMLCGGFLCCRMLISNVGTDLLNANCTTTSQSIAIKNVSRHCQTPTGDQNQLCLRIPLLLEERESL